LLQGLQLFEGPVMGAIQGAFVAHQQGEGLAVIGEFLKDPGDAIVVVHIGELVVDVFVAAHEFGVERVRFDAADAAETPAGGCHRFDQFGFEGGLGVELVHVGIEEELELFAGFGGEDDGLGGQAMADGVAG
jgi:hypothetical protein